MVLYHKLDLAYYPVHFLGGTSIPLIAGLLAQPQQSESDLRYLLSSLAAVSGYPSLASAIEALDASLE